MSGFHAKKFSFRVNSLLFKVRFYALLYHFRDPNLKRIKKLFNLQNLLEFGLYTARIIIELFWSWLQLGLKNPFLVIKTYHLLHILTYILNFMCIVHCIPIIFLFPKAKPLQNWFQCRILRRTTFLVYWAALWAYRNHVGHSGQCLFCYQHRRFSDIQHMIQIL